MKIMNKICQLRRDISFILASILIASFFFVNPVQEVNAAGDSNSMVQAYIGLMSGQKAVNIQNIESLTTDDLRCIALYLSNYYVPYLTSLDGEAKETTLEGMTNALVRDLGMAHETAEKLADATLQASLQSTRQLYFSSGEVLNGKPVPVIDTSEITSEIDKLIKSYNKSTGATLSWRGFWTGKVFSGADKVQTIKVWQLLAAVGGFDDSSYNYHEDENSNIVSLHSCTYNSKDKDENGEIPEEKRNYTIYVQTTDGYSQPSNLDEQKELLSLLTSIAQLYNNTGMDLRTAYNNGFITEDMKVYDRGANSEVTYAFGKVDIDSDKIQDASGYIGFGDDAKDPGLYMVESGNGDSAAFATLGGTIPLSGGHLYPCSVFAYTTIFNVMNNVGDASGTYRPRGFFLDENQNPVPCFVWNDYTALVQMFFADYTDAYEDGRMGNYIISTSARDWLDRVTYIQEGLTSCTQGVYVDWVGNIIADIGTERVVLYPACLNPYTFVDISNSDGQLTYGIGSTNTLFNSLSLFGQKLIGAGTLNVSPTEPTIEVNGTKLLWTEGQLKFKAVVSRGVKQEHQTWDSYGGIGAGDNGDLKSMLDSDSGSYGMSTGTNDKADTNTYIKVTGKSKTDTPFSNGINILQSYVTYTNTLTSKEAAHILDGKVLHTLDDAATWNLGTATQKWRSGDSEYANFIQIDKSDTQNMKNIFLTYVFMYNNSKEGVPEEAQYVPYKFNASHFPESVDDSIVWDDLGADSEKVTSFVYYLLHPTEGAAYVTTLLKNKISGFFVGWHEDIVGATDSNSTTGMTQYLGVSSYVTTPNLTSLEWMAKLIDWYNNIIVYLIILMCLILFCYVLTGYITVGRGVIGLVLFAILAFVPPVAINMVADYSNRITDTIFSDKFDYWTYTQHQTYLAKLDEINEAAASAGTSAQDIASATADYISAIQVLNEDLHGAESGSGDIGFSGVRLKWMCPKKVHENQEGESEIEEALSYSDFSGLFTSLVVTTVTFDNTQDFTESVGQTYLYRDFFDIYRHGAVGYNLRDYVDVAGTIPSATTADWQGNYNRSGITLSDIKYSSGEKLRDYVNSNIEGQRNSLPQYINDTSSVDALAKGFIPSTANDSNSLHNYYYVLGAKTGGSDDSGNPQSHRSAVTLLLGYPNTISDVHSYLTSLQDSLQSSSNNTMTVSLDGLRKLGGTSGSIVYGRQASDFANFGINELIRAGSGESSDTPDMSDMSDFYYSLYAESPYYYFNFAFRDYIQGTGSGYMYNELDLASDTTHVASALLANNQDFFFNLTDNSGNGYGELRDFMNMHDLFYYIIPALDEGNQLADLFNDRFGMYVHSDCSLQITNTGEIIYDDYTANSMEDLLNTQVRAAEGDGTLAENLTQEEIYKLWHDYNVWLIFQTYIPWLDTMEDCEYAKPETIEVLGEKFQVINPLDPTCYFQTDDSGNVTAGRYMVFSRSEMAYYGLDITDLTLVEQKIIECQDNVYKQALDLMNYYTLSDEVLINAFSIIETFEFNKIFSETNPLGSSYILYPQGYEARAFSYDAYLRLIISEASREPLQVDVEEGSDGAGTSIYRRVLSKTSLFFGIFLLINDVLAVYVIPVLKLTVLVLLFFVSVALIIGASIKLELNIIDVCWKSIFAPLISYFLISIGFSWVVSLFMSSGASQVVKTSQTISLGDPTMAILMMIAINVTLTILYWKIFKKCFKDLKTYITSIASSIASTAVGAFKKIANTVMNGNDGMRRVRKTIKKSSENGMPGGVPSTAKQRGRANGLGALGAAATGALGGMAAHGALDAAGDGLPDEMKGASKREIAKYNKLDAKNDKSYVKSDKLRDRANRLDKTGGIGAGLRSKILNGRADALEKRGDRQLDYRDKLANGGMRAMRKAQMNDIKSGVKSRAQFMANKAQAGANTVKRGMEATKSGIQSGMSQVKTVSRQGIAKVKGSAERLHQGGAGMAMYGAKQGAKNVAHQAASTIRSGVDAARAVPGNVANTLRQVPSAAVSFGKSTVQSARVAGYRTQTAMRSAGDSVVRGANSAYVVAKGAAKNAANMAGRARDWSKETAAANFTAAKYGMV